MVIDVVLAAIAGAAVGSALANFAWHWPNRLRRMLTTRSKCEACEGLLGFLDLLPVVGWFVRRGSCAFCGTAIPAYYWQVELVASLVSAISIAVLGVHDGIPAAIAGLILLLLARIDLDHMRLPDALTLPLIGLGLIGTIMYPTWPGPTPQHAALGGAVGFSLLFAIRWVYAKTRGRQGLGLGDVKLFAASGVWCGAAALPWILVLAASSGIVTALLRGQRIDSEKPMPFGPNLALAAWLAMIWQWSAP